MSESVVKRANRTMSQELGRSAALRFILHDAGSATLVDVAGLPRPLGDFDMPVLERMVAADLVAPVASIVFAAAQQEFAAGERAGRALERHLTRTGRG